MQGAWHGRRDEGWVDVFRCSAWNVKAGVLGEAQLVMSDSLRFMSLESSSHTAYSYSYYNSLFWTLSWYFKHAGSINACWKNLDHKKHTAHIQQVLWNETLIGKVCTGKPHYSFSSSWNVQPMESGFYFSFLKQMYCICTGQVWRPL